MTVSIDAARRDLQGPCAKQVIVDAAAMHQSCRHLIKKAREHGLRLRQNYNRAVPRLAAQIRRYAHAKQYKRMRKAVKALCTLVRRPHMLFEAAKTRLQDPLQRTARILTRCAKDKPYALRAPETERISKGQARIPPAGSM